MDAPARTTSGRIMMEEEVFVIEEGWVVNGSGVETSVVEVKINDSVEVEGVVAEGMLMVKTLKCVSALPEEWI